MNFGFFANDTVATKFALIGIALVVCAVLVFVVLRMGQHSYSIAGGMIVGGGLSNVFERIVFGFVFDYM